VLENAEMAVLLFSKEFLASEFIKNEELPLILKSAGEKGTILLILLINRCVFELVPHLSQYQTVNPTDRLLSKLPEEEQDEYFIQVVEEMLNVFNKE
jgi:hypothetical protein